MKNFLEKSASDDAINATCNYDPTCVADTLASGLQSLGLQTAATIKTTSASAALLSTISEIHIIFLDYKLT